MIQPIKLNNSLAFKGEPVRFPLQNTPTSQAAPVAMAVGSETTQASQDVRVKPESQGQAQVQENLSPYKKAKKSVLGFFKSINNVTNTTQGVLLGAARGAATAVAVGLVGRSIKNAKGQIGDTLKNMGSDIWTAVKETVCFFPKLLTKPLVEDAKDVLTLAPRFYSEYLKGNKATAAIATVAGLGVFAFNAFKGKINANVKNANLDHQFNNGHVK